MDDVRVSEQPIGNRRRTLGVRLAASAVFVVVLLVACGDDEAGVVDEAPATEETAPESTTEATPLPEPTPTPDEGPPNVSFSLVIATDSGRVGLNIDDAGCAMTKGTAPDPNPEPPSYVVRDEAGTILAAGNVLGFASEDDSPSAAFGLVGSTSDDPDGYLCEVGDSIFIEGAGSAQFLEIELTVGGQTLTEVRPRDATGPVEVFVSG